MILTEIDSSALGDGESQRMLGCTRIQPWVDPFQSARRAERVWPEESGLEDRTAISGQDGTKYVPPGEASVGRIRSSFCLARLLCLVQTEESSR